MISYQAPALCQGADEDLLLTIGDAVDPGLVRRHAGEPGLRLWVEGTATDGQSQAKALGRFQTVLGVLRVLRPSAGLLWDEVVGGVGQGPIRDDEGNQWVMAPTIATSDVSDDDRTFAANAAAAVHASENLRSALRLNGRANRTAGDYYMIHEYACRELGEKDGIANVLGLSRRQQDKLTQSANRLPALEGGRHVNEPTHVPLALDQQKAFVAELLRRWIDHLAGPCP